MTSRNTYMQKKNTCEVLVNLLLNLVAWYTLIIFIIFEYRQVLVSWLNSFFWISYYYSYFSLSAKRNSNNWICMHFSLLWQHIAYKFRNRKTRIYHFEMKMIHHLLVFHLVVCLKQMLFAMYGSVWCAKNINNKKCFDHNLN